MVFDFLLELEVALIPVLAQGPVFHSQEDCASRFLGVCAVREATVLRVFPDFDERIVQSVTRPKKSQFAHSRCIDQHGPTIKNEQLAAGSGMDTFSSSADRPGVKRVVSDQSVDECGLSDARGAKQAVRFSGNKERAELVQANTRCVADGKDVGGAASVFYLPDYLIKLLRRYQVCLGQYDPRLNRPLVSHHKVSVQPGQVEIVSTGLNDKGDIDVCRDHLEICRLAWGLPAQERLSRYDAMDYGGTARCVALHAHPVAHTGQIYSRLNCETQLSRDFRIGLAVLISDEEGTPIHGCDARHAVPRLQKGVGALFKPAVIS